MIRAEITFRESIATQRVSGRVLFVMSNLRSTRTFYITDIDVEALQKVCVAHEWELTMTPVYPTSVPGIETQMAQVSWKPEDDVEMAEITDRMNGR